MKMPFNLYNIKRSAMSVSINTTADNFSMKTFLSIQISPSLNPNLDYNYVAKRGEKLYDHQNGSTILIYDDKIDQFIQSIRDFITMIKTEGPSDSERTSTAITSGKNSVMMIQVGNTYGVKIAKEDGSSIIYQFRSQNNGSQVELNKFINFLKSYCSGPNLIMMRLLEAQNVDMENRLKKTEGNVQTTTAQSAQPKQQQVQKKTTSTPKPTPAQSNIDIDGFDDFDDGIEMNETQITKAANNVSQDFGVDGDDLFADL